LKTTMRDAAHQALGELLSQPVGSWTLAEGALAIARLEHPELDAPGCLAELDRLAAAARESVGDARHPRFLASGIARVLFQDERFRLAEDDNETLPASCLLDQVLATRIGAPTLLALVFVEIARRAGFRFETVALPGHFLLRHGASEDVFLFDPAREGRPVSLDEARRMVADGSGGRAEFREGFLRPLTPPQVLARILANLKAIYWRGPDYERALDAVELMLAIRPDDPREIRDRGRLLFLMGRMRDAIVAFESYLAHNPRGEDADVVRMLLVEARAGLRAQR
jgi:regulator of sirC expression with transglutaminase-like and TPR domain